VFVDSAPKHLSMVILDYFANAYGGAAVEANCEVIIAAHVARKVKAAGMRIAAISEPGQTALAEAQAELAAITAGEKSELADMRSVITKVVDGVMRRYEAKTEQLFGLSTGFSGLDAMLDGLTPGLTILAARPSMGKTAFILQMASNIAVKVASDEMAGTKPGVFIGSLEMTCEPLGRRLLAQLGRINATHLKKPKLLTEDEWPRLTRATTDLKNSNILIWEKTRVTPQQMAGQMYRAAANGKIGLFVVDHIGLLLVDQRNRSSSLGDASMVLTKVSMETGIPLVVLSQLNRASEGEPTLKDLRDSGELEQNARTVIFIHRPNYYTPGGASKSGITKIIVAKQSDGETGVIDQYWHGPWQQFMNPTAEHYAAEQANEQQAQAKPKTQFQATFGGRKK